MRKTASLQATHLPAPSLTSSPKTALLRRLLLAWSGAVLLALALPSGAGAGTPAFPPLNGYVVDEAQILSPQSKTEIASNLSALEAQSSDQLFVFIAKSLQGYAIEDYGYQLGRAWGAGLKGLNNGAVLIVVPSERKVRIEVGRGLEPYLTDAMSTLVIENTILPAIREGNVADAIAKGVQDISKVLLSDAEAAAQRAKAAAKLREWWTPPDAVIVAFFAVTLTVLFFFLFYMNLRSLRKTRAKDAARLSRASRSKGASGKADPAGQEAPGGRPGTVGDIFIALGMTVFEFFSSGGSSRGSSGSSGSSSSGGGGGDFGGGGASGSA